MKRLIKEFFFLTRGERRALITVSIILLCSVFFRLWVGSRKYQNLEPDPDFLVFVEQLREKIDSAEVEYLHKIEALGDSGQSSSRDPNCEVRPFVFNPNTISFDSLERMRLPAKVVSNLIKYREAGGTFRKKEDIKKIYGVSDELYDLLKAYVQIDLETEEAAFRDSGVWKVQFEEEEVPMISLNEADTSELWILPGIGVSFARRIVKYRDLLGGYNSKEQLLEVYGMDSIRYKLFCSNVFIDSALLERLDLNKADFKSLISHPYVSKEMCYAILQYREYKGQIKAVDELEKNQVIDHESYIKLCPYVEVKFNKD